MKKAALFTLSAGFLITLSFFMASYLRIIRQKQEVNQKSSKSMDSEEAGLWDWEQMRLQDPVTGMIPDHIQQKEQIFASYLPSDDRSDNSALRTLNQSSWAQVGPWNVGGRTRAMAIDINNDNVIIAGSVSGTLFRSVNGGKNWTPVSSLAMEPFGSTCIVQDPRKDKTNIWYLGTGENIGSSAGAVGAYYQGNGVYKSLDSGITWTSLSATVYNAPQSFHPFDGIWNIAVNPVDTAHDEVYCAVIGGIYKSLDGGNTWNTAIGTPGNSSTDYTDLVITPSGIIYATLSSGGSKSGIWRSTDGITFTNITPISFPATYNRIVMGYAPSDLNQVYFLANTPGFGRADSISKGNVNWNSLWKYRYVSGDGSGAGGNWTDLSSNLPGGGTQTVSNFETQGTGYDMLVKVLPTDTNIVFIGGTNLYRSTDGFKTKNNVHQIGGYHLGLTSFNGPPVNSLYPDHHPDQHALAFFSSSSNSMVSSNDGGVFKTLNNTLDTVQWISLDSGYVTSQFFTVAMDHASSGDNVVTGGLQDNGSRFTNSPDLTIPWTFPAGGDGNYCAIADHKSMYYFATTGSRIFKESLDVNGNVTGLNRIDPIGGKGYLFVNPYLLDPNNNNLMYLAGGNFIWRNNDLSAIPLLNKYDSISTNWIKFPDSINTGTISALAISKTNPVNRLYYGTSAGALFKIDSASSYTGAIPPVNRTTGLTNAGAATNGYITCITVNPLNANNIMVVYSNYNVYSLFYSTDGGITFTKVAGNLEQFSSGSGDGPSCRWASIIPVNNGTVYMVATSTGLYATDTLMGLATVWIQQGSNTIGGVVCDMIDYRTTDGFVAVATHGKGVFTTHITSTKDVMNIDELKKQSDISLTNFPNPFSNSTTIAINLETPSKVTIQVMDTKGEMEETIITNQEMAAGTTNISFNSNTYSPGMYYVVVTTGSKVKIQKMLIVK